MGTEPSTMELQRLTRRAFVGRTAGLVAGAGLSGSLLAACGGDDEQTSSAGGKKLDQVTFLTIIPLNLGFITELVGTLNGHFKKEGLDVKIQSTRGSAQAIQSVLQGSALVTRAGAIESVIAISKQNAPLLDIGMQWHKSPLGFASAEAKPLRVPADWKGKKMGIPSEGGTSEWTLDLMLASAGVPLDSVERQVVGFSPGTFDLVKKGRIDGYVIGSTEIVRFASEVPDAVVIDPSKYVEEGQCYLASKRAMAEKKDQLTAFMNATRAAADDVVADRDNDYKKIIELVRTKYDFPELKDDKIAQGVMKGQVDAWFVNGEENLMKTVPENWQKVYDQLVKVKLVPGGKDPKPWFTNELVS